MSITKFPRACSYIYTKDVLVGGGCGYVVGCVAVHCVMLKRFQPHLIHANVSSQLPISHSLFA